MSLHASNKYEEKGIPLIANLLSVKNISKCIKAQYIPANLFCKNFNRK